MYHFYRRICMYLVRNRLVREVSCAGKTASPDVKSNAPSGGQKTQEIDSESERGRRNETAPRDERRQEKE